jgi:type III secretory pathway component EscS
MREIGLIAHKTNLGEQTFQLELKKKLIAYLMNWQGVVRTTIYNYCEKVHLKISILQIAGDFK